MQPRRSYIIIFLSFIILLSALPLAALPGASPPQIQARAAILYDLETGALLYEKNADHEIPPASMTKLMSLHLAYREIESGRLSRNQLIPVTAAASFKSSPPRSSLMFLEEGQKVTLLDLMIGLALPSGNDAGVALADVVAGSMPAFVDAMNREARRLGLEKTRFVDSFGYSEENLTTPREFASFCRTYLETHPEALEELHSLKEYTYPRPENLTEGAVATHGSITQYNTNVLVGVLEGVDGLKTGYIDESGYNLAVTAEREGRRLLAVLMGGPGENSREGSLIRAVDATALLSFGFYATRTFTPELPPLPVRRVYKGSLRSTALAVPELPLLTLPAEESGALSWEFQWHGPLTAPLETDTTAGLLVCRGADGGILFTRPLLVRDSIAAGSFWRRLWDSLVLKIRGDRG